MAEVRADGVASGEPSLSYSESRQRKTKVKDEGEVKHCFALGFQFSISLLGEVRSLRSQMMTAPINRVAMSKNKVIMINTVLYWV